MLVDLRISNFVIFKEQCIGFGPGLNVISGDTGSGKSVVLQALELLLGARPKAGNVGWEIEGLFRLDHLPEKIIQNLPDIAQGKELSITRSMLTKGRGRVFVNGKLVTVTVLEDITKKLVNICGQNQFVRLLDPKFHLELVDGYGGNELLIEKYQKAYRDWKAKAGRLQELESKQEQSVLRRAELVAILEDLSAVNLQSGVRDELEQEVRKLGAAEKILSLGDDTLSTLRGRNMTSSFTAITNSLIELGRLSPDMNKLSDQFISARTEIEEFERDLKNSLRKVVVNETELEKLREELAAIASLERKYRTNDAGLVQLKEEVEEELSLFEEGGGIQGMREEVAKLKKAATDIATKLSASRARAAKKIVREVESELAELNMLEAELEFSFTECELSSSGIDRGEFLISTNRGQEKRPLGQIASGGELSRLMLVLKKILRDRSGVNVLVFDEVDSGVSGGVARAVGEKLKSLSERSQVLCITHLPQVASLADHHLRVEKITGTQSTESLVRELSEKERVEEIARMLAGYQVTDAARESARELLTSNS